MEKTQQRAQNPALVMMTMKEAAAELIANSAAIERDDPLGAAFMAGYIARFIEIKAKEKGA